MAVFAYNGVTLPYANIVSFEQEAVYDESNTDRLYTKYTVHVQQAVVNFNYLDQLNSDLLIDNAPATVNAADILGSIRALLLRPRRSLVVRFNGVDLIPVVSGLNGTVDAKNGPRPISCNITTLTNQTFLIDYRIEAHYWEGGTQTDPEASPINTNPNGNIIISHRWGESVDIDEDHYTTRTRAGRLVIRSDNYAGIIADIARVQLAAVSLPQGFVRKSSRYRVSPDGLSLEYEISDREVFKMPPYPAFTARGVYTESVSRAGAVRYGQVNVGLKASKDVSQTTLLRRAVEVCSSKLLRRGRQIGIMGGGGGGVAVLESASASINLYENEVDVMLKGMFGATKKRVNYIAAFADIGMFTPLSDGLANEDHGRHSQKYHVYGSDHSLYLLHAAAYYDPSLRNLTMNGPRSQLSQGREVGEAGVVREE